MPTSKRETPVRVTSEAQEVKVKTKMDPVAKLLGTSRAVAYRPEFAHITGMVTAGVLLSQFWYWSECPTTEKRDGWFYMTMDQISEQTGMIREEQETARKRLKAIGVLQEERRGNPGRMWFRLDEDRLYELLREYAETVKAGIPQCDNPAIKNAGIPQSKVRELRNLARGNATIKNAGIPQCILLESSSGESSIDFSGDETAPPINPPEGEDAGSCATAECPVNGAIEVWSRVKSVVKINPAVTEALYGCHIQTLKVVSIDPTTDTCDMATVTLSAVNAWSRDYVEKRGWEALQAAFREVLGERVAVRFVAGK